MDELEPQSFRLVTESNLVYPQVVQAAAAMALAYVGFYAIVVLVVMGIYFSDAGTVLRAAGILVVLAGVGWGFAYLYRHPIKFKSDHEKLKISGQLVSARAIVKDGDRWPTDIGNLEEYWLTLDVTLPSQSIRLRTKVDDITYQKFNLGSDISIRINLEQKEWCRA